MGPNPQKIWPHLANEVIFNGKLCFLFIIPLKPLLSKNNNFKQFRTLYPLGKPHWNLDNIVSKYAFIWSYIIP